MSSNIAVLKNLVEGMSQEEKVKVAKEGHHPLVPVYMVIDSLKKEQEMDKTLQELEAASNLPPAEETIKDRLVAAVSRPGGLRSLDSATGSEAIGPSYAGDLSDMPGLGAGEAMPRSYTGPTWAPRMPTGTLTAARGGMVPGYANGGFYGQQEEEDYGFLPDAQERPEPLQAGFPAAAIGAGSALWRFGKPVLQWMKANPLKTTAGVTSIPIFNAVARSFMADPEEDALNSRPLIPESPSTNVATPILSPVLAQGSTQPLGIRQLVDRSVSSGLRTGLHDEIKSLRDEYAKLTPGQQDRAEYIQQQIQQLQGLETARRGTLTGRKDTFERTAAEDLASLEDRYNKKVKAVDEFTERRIGQIEGRLQPRIDEGIASLESSAADYDTDKRAAALLALSDTLGARNVDPRRSNFSSIGEAIGEFEDDALKTATDTKKGVRDIEDALAEGVINYEDLGRSALEQLDDSWFASQKDMRDRLREGTYGYEDSLLELATGTQDAIDLLNLGLIDDQTKAEIEARKLDDPLLTLMQSQLQDAERTEQTTQRAMDERMVAQIEASGQNIPTREDAQAQLNYARDLRERMRGQHRPDDLEEMIEAAEDFGHYWMDYHRRNSPSRPTMDFRALMPDSTDLNSDSTSTIPPTHSP
jgi:hypothetical protein